MILFKSYESVFAYATHNTCRHSPHASRRWANRALCIANHRTATKKLPEARAEQSIHHQHTSPTQIPAFAAKLCNVCRHATGSSRASSPATAATAPNYVHHFEFHHTLSTTQVCRHVAWRPAVPSLQPPNKMATKGARWRQCRRRASSRLSKG